MEELLERVGQVVGVSPLDLLVSMVHRALELRMQQTAYVVHSIPGRIRLRIPQRRNDVSFFESVRTRLLDLESVQDVKVTPATAGILIHYSGTTAQGLLTEAMMAGFGELGTIERGLPPIESIGERLVTRLNTLNRGISAATTGQIDGAGVVLLFLLAAGTLQILRGQVLGSAVPLLWYAGQAISGVLPSRLN